MPFDVGWQTSTTGSIGRPLEGAVTGNANTGLARIQRRGMSGQESERSR